MLDLRFIRENPELVKAGIAKKNDKSDIDKILALDERRREIIRTVESKKADKNRASGEIAKKKKAGESADDAIAAMRQLGDDITALDAELRELESDLQDRLNWIPNIPHESVPVGKDESANVIVRSWGEIPKNSFNVLPHWEVGEKLGILDLATAPPRYPVPGFILRGLGARLQRALINYMLDMHTSPGFVEHHRTVYRDCRHDVRHRSASKDRRRHVPPPKTITCT